MEMESDTLVLLVGAGASYGARASSDVPPPLGKNLAQYLLRWLRSNRPVARTHACGHSFHDPMKHCVLYTGTSLWREPRLAQIEAALADVAAGEHDHHRVPPFEQLMDAWASKGDTQALLRQTQRVLGLSMLVGHGCAFLDRPDLYDRLVAEISPYERIIVLTLNYDLLLEDALRRAGRGFTYPRLPGVAGTIFTHLGSGTPVPIFKLHGSIGWMVVPDIGIGTDLSVLRKNTKPIRLVSSGPIVARQTSGTYVPPNRVSLFHELEESAGSNYPVAAVYGTGKPLLENPEHVEAHREACVASLGDLDAADVLAIGVRPVGVTDDPVAARALDMISRLKGQKTYVGPSPNECEQFRRLGFTAEQCTLASWLEASRA